ncbi:MAG: DUF86 domain-containing protein [Nitrospirae bacterium]|nr:DUF86 domain-containing protein [Nitrospirota bacterium]
MEKEVKFRLIKHITFLENELKDFKNFESLSWEEYNSERDKRRNVERWIENIINSSIDIAKIILSYEGQSLADTYKEMIERLAVLPSFDKKNIEQLSRWVRLRNIISHEYLDIRWSSIKKFISEARLFYEDFLEKAKAYLEKRT